jgi:DNA-binding MarR family transcriptional regulator
VTTADEATHLYVVLGRITRALRRAAAGSEIGHGSLSALATLVSDGPMRLGELAAVEGISAPSMTRIIAALEERELVQRRADPADGRALVVEVTEPGRTLVRTGREARIGELRARLTALSADDRRTLDAALPVLESLSCPD